LIDLGLTTLKVTSDLQVVELINQSGNKITFVVLGAVMNDKPDTSSLSSASSLIDLVANSKLKDRNFSGKLKL